MTFNAQHKQQNGAKSKFAYANRKYPHPHIRLYFVGAVHLFICGCPMNVSTFTQASIHLWNHVALVLAHYNILHFCLH